MATKKVYRQKLLKVSIKAGPDSSVKEISSNKTKKKSFPVKIFPNKEEEKILKQIDKNEGRLRYKGKFINKEAETRIRKFLKKVPLTKENIENAFEKELFFTFRSNEISDVLNDHKGPILLNGDIFELPEAIIEFDTLNKENFREWSDELDIDEASIFFIVYDATYNPETKQLDIDTMVNDESRVVTSNPEIKKKTRGGKRQQKKKALKLAKENKRKINEKPNLQRNKQRQKFD